MKKGFTLIELLVVIAIIAVLMGILMPALSRVRAQARGIACLANQRSLSQAYIMYTDENDNRVCGGYVFTGPRNKIPPWALAPLDYAGKQIVPMPTGDVTLQQRLNGLVEGVLFTYIKDEGAYHCPGDNRARQGTSLGNQLQYAMYRSYVLTDYMRATEPGDPKSLTQFKNPSMKMLFVEEIYDGLAQNHSSGWSFSPGEGSLWDPLGIFHSDASTFSFMDGHAERKKWTDKRTITFFRSRTEAASLGFGRLQKFNPLNEDVTWLDQHYPGKTRVK